MRILFLITIVFLYSCSDQKTKEVSPKESPTEEKTASLVNTIIFTGEFGHYRVLDKKEEETANDDTIPSWHFTREYHIPNRYISLTNDKSGKFKQILKVRLDSTFTVEEVLISDGQRSRQAMDKRWLSQDSEYLYIGNPYITDRGYERGFEISSDGLYWCGKWVAEIVIYEGHTTFKE